MVSTEISSAASVFMVFLMYKFLSYLRGNTWSTVSQVTTGRSIYNWKCLRHHQIFSWLLKRTG